MPSEDELIREVQKTIGAGNSATDWRIVPTAHAKELEAKAPALAGSLSGSRVQGLARQYEDLNDAAVAARDDFKRTIGKADVAVFVTASLAGSLLVAAGLQDRLGRAGPYIAGGVGLLGIISGGLATMWLSRVKEGHLNGKWVSLRAKAEAKRLAYFKAVMEGAPPTPQEQLLAFEYTRRYLLDNQIDYFRDRRKQHEAADGAARVLSTQCVFVASALTAGAGLLAMLKPQLALMAALSVIASARAALAKSRSAMNQDRKNADRYHETAEILDDRRLDIDAYREGVAKEPNQTVSEFFEPIFVALAADHKAFLSDAEQRDLAIGGMEQRLDAAKEALDKKPEAGKAAVPDDA